MPLGSGETDDGSKSNEDGGSLEKENEDHYEDKNEGEDVDEDEDEGEDELETITRNHLAFLAKVDDELMLGERKENEITDTIFKSSPDLRISLAKPGSMHRTILHLIAAKQSTRSRSRWFLVPWLMGRYPTLYQARDDLGRTLLSKRSRNFPDPFLQYFVEKFPKEAADLVDSDGEILPMLVSANIYHLSWSQLLEHVNPSSLLNQDTRGNTLLHIAAHCDHETSSETELESHQLGVITAIFDRCPEALTRRNYRGLSAYQVHISSGQKSASPANHMRCSISWFLKYKIMHLENRSEVIELLYGNSLAPEIHLDLLELANRTVNEDTLNNMIRRLKFEEILTYVRIPQFKLSRSAPLGLYGQKSDFSLAPESTNALHILLLMQEMGVKKIIRLMVDDGVEAPHRDADIERALSPFDVEDLDWKKLDLFSGLVLVAAKNIQRLCLYSSGNAAVLHSWSSLDGLLQLAKLKDIRISINEQLEGSERTSQNVFNFQRRLKETQMSLSRIGITLSIQQVDGRKVDAAWSTVSIVRPSKTDSWLHGMDRFARFIIRSSLIGSPSSVKVAVIDDGIDMLQENDQLNESIKAGASFAKSGDFDNTTQPFFFSSSGHGTTTARLITRICPTAQLFIARVDFDGDMQVSIESCAKAIMWAVAQKVHVICMNWTFGDLREDVLYKLQRSIKLAANNNILMISATRDDKTRSVPWNFDRVFYIGGSTPGESQVEDRDADFIFPGSDTGAKSLIEFNERSADLEMASGSSFATALATGFVALILYCVDKVSQSDKGSHQKLQDHHIMAKVLRSMAYRTEKGSRDPKVIANTAKYFDPDLEDLDIETATMKFTQDIEGILRLVWSRDQ